MNDSILFFETASPQILNDIQDTLVTVAHNTRPYVVMSVDATWMNLMVAAVACFASLCAAYFAFKDWRTQKRTADSIEMQNVRFVDFMSQAKDMYRTLVYALAIGVKHRQTAGEDRHYYPQEVYFEKTKPLSDLIPIQSFVNNEIALEALNDLLIQMRTVCIEHDDAVALVREVKSGRMSFPQYLEQYDLMYSNISFKPFHIIHQMMIAGDKLRQAGVGCNLNAHSLALCILEKHNGFVTGYPGYIDGLTKDYLTSIDIDFQHVERACRKFNRNDDDYIVRISDVACIDDTSAPRYTHLREVLDDKEYEKLFSEEGVSIWSILPTLYKVEVACELMNDRMQFYVK